MLTEVCAFHPMTSILSFPSKHSDDGTGIACDLLVLATNVTWYYDADTKTVHNYDRYPPVCFDGTRLSS